MISSNVSSADSTIDSEGFKGGTRGAPIMPRDCVSRTANVESNGGHKWVKMVYTRKCFLNVKNVNTFLLQKYILGKQMGLYKYIYRVYINIYMGFM